MLHQICLQLLQSSNFTSVCAKHRHCEETCNDKIPPSSHPREIQFSASGATFDQMTCRLCFTHLDKQFAAGLTMLSL